MGIAPATNPPTVQYPPYTPMGSLGHELGILFGFLGACIFVMAIYTVLWQGIPSSFPLIHTVKLMRSHPKSQRIQRPCPP